MNTVVSNPEFTYNNLINKALKRGLIKEKVLYYTESHHIKPLCLGGLDVQENKVLLTPYEHYTAHKLLVEIYPSNFKLKHAFWTMTITSKSGLRDYEVPEYDYNKAREGQSKAMAAIWKNPEFKKSTGQAISKSLNRPDIKAKRASAIKLALSTYESKIKRSKSSKDVYNRPGVRENHRKVISDSWKIEEYRNNRIKGIKARASTKEAKVIRSEASKLVNKRPGHKDKISNSCKISKRISPIWEEPLKTDILNFWLESSKPGYITFRKLAVKNGFPDLNYNAIINKHFIKELNY